MFYICLFAVVHAQTSGLLYSAGYGHCPGLAKKTYFTFKYLVFTVLRFVLVFKVLFFMLLIHGEIHLIFSVSIPCVCVCVYNYIKYRVQS